LKVFLNVPLEVFLDVFIDVFLEGFQAVCRGRYWFRRGAGAVTPWSPARRGRRADNADFVAESGTLALGRDAVSRRSCGAISHRRATPGAR
jgi:hypothetical protein